MEFIAIAVCITEITDTADIMKIAIVNDTARHASIGIVNAGNSNYPYR